uniref:Uncharacterized protein n=1 Tax=Tanacetum cinerariifolium TaxID=118510 RepID=A0A699IC35_TANCI|nr:hypothetical protein [Tanacetum cinerariifolium]
MPTKIKLTLEQSQQGVSYDVLVAVCSSLRVLKSNAHKIESRANKRSIINLIGHNVQYLYCEMVLLNRSLVPAKSISYYQAFNVKSLFGEIVSPKKSQVKPKCQTRLIVKISKHECLKPLQIKTTLHEKLSINQESQVIRSNPSNDRDLDIGRRSKVRDLDIEGDC